MTEFWARYGQICSESDDHLNVVPPQYYRNKILGAMLNLSVSQKIIVSKTSHMQDNGLKAKYSRTLIIQTRWEAYDQVG